MMIFVSCTLFLLEDITNNWVTQQTHKVIDATWEKSGMILRKCHCHSQLFQHSRKRTGSRSMYLDGIGKVILHSFSPCGSQAGVIKQPTTETLLICCITTMTRAAVIT